MPKRAAIQPSTGDLLDYMVGRAKSMQKDVSDEAFTLRGLWCSHYVLRLAEASTAFNLRYVRAQTVGQGCCYYEYPMREPILTETMLGRNILEESTTRNRALKIACLDAAFASLICRPADSMLLTGNNIEKSAQRAEIVCKEALSMLRKRTPRNGKRHKIVDVGVVGDFVYFLKRQEGVDVAATDFYGGIVGKTVHGVRVRHGRETEDEVSSADVALVTGMALANRTLDKIIKTARESNTSIVIFAETGANFAEEYCKLGVDVVVSEPYPFYLECAGNTQINVYRRS